VSNIKLLVVGGGGGGGSHVGGGGGGGGVYDDRGYHVTPRSNISVTVGAGGVGAQTAGGICLNIAATSGGTSIFGNVNVLGGANGASWEWQYAGKTFGGEIVPAANGGGGSATRAGMAWYDGSQGVESPGQSSGKKGGNALDTSKAYQFGYPAGGGAGATTDGGVAKEDRTSGNGGTGRLSAITNTYFGGGGGGGFHGGGESTLQALVAKVVVVQETGQLTVPLLVKQHLE
jgi:hypothetical protein